MVKINENEALISRHELFVLVGAAGAHWVRENRLEKCGLALMDFAMHIYRHIARHIWEGKKLPEQSTEFLMGAITPDGTGRKGQGLGPEEDKQLICTLLLAELQKTKTFQNLISLRYIPDSTVEVEFASGNKRLINVEADSGIAMARDILVHL